MENKKMNDHQKHWYMEEIAIHSMFACLEYNNIKEVLADEELKQTRFVWGHMTSLLGHCAMVSKFLDPIRPDEVSTSRSVELNKHFNLPHYSRELFRAARDNLEHFDERIDNWLKNDFNNNIECVFPDRKSYEFSAPQDISIRRVLVEDGMIFISEGRNSERVEVPLSVLISSMESIFAVANEWCRNKTPYHFIQP